eukprot:217894-Pleurochrysis_carterae.AAC.1
MELGVAGGRLIRVSPADPARIHVHHTTPPARFGHKDSETDVSACHAQRDAASRHRYNDSLRRPILVAGLTGVLQSKWLIATHRPPSKQKAHGQNSSVLSLCRRLQAHPQRVRALPMVACKQAWARERKAADRY